MLRSIRRLTVGAAASLLLAACAGQAAPDTASDSSPSSGRHTMADGSTMSDATMREMSSDDGESGASGADESAPAPGDVTHRQDGPSSAAAMICSLEIAKAVQSAFALPSVPSATDGWVEQTYTCTYELPDSTVRLSVKDLDGAPAGRAWFDALAGRLERARPVTGLPNLGFPAVETPGSVGSVAFLKDHKTLWVDAGNVAPRDLRPGFSRTATAYNVAAHVIACWME